MMPRGGLRFNVCNFITVFFMQRSHVSEISFLSDNDIFFMLTH